MLRGILFCRATPAAECRLQERDDAGDEEDGADQLTDDDTVLREAEGGREDEGRRQGGAEHRQVVLANMQATMMYKLLFF